MSYSKIKTYDCPKRYEYQYIQRLPRISNSRNSLPGRAIQKLFELFVNSREFSNGSQWLYANVAQIFENEYNKYKDTTKFHVGETYEDVLEDVADMIPNSYDLFVKKGWNMGHVDSEVRLKSQLTNNVALMGDLDFLIKTDKGVILMDFKSTAKGIKALDKEQLIIYNHLYKTKYGKYPDSTYFFLIRDNQLLNVNITEEMVEKTINNVLKVAEGIEKKDFHKVATSKTCRFCPFKKTCWSPKRSPW